MQITSEAFGEQGAIPRDYGCDGANRSPPLRWTDPPAGTRSFALIVDDPDAPGDVFGHWGAFDLAADRRRLEAGAGNGPGRGFRQARNDFGDEGYGGPCPPRGHGPHRYRFRLMALDVDRLALGPRPTILDLEEGLQGHVIASSLLTARFERR